MTTKQNNKKTSHDNEDSRQDEQQPSTQKQQGKQGRTQSMFVCFIVENTYYDISKMK